MFSSEETDDVFVLMKIEKEIMDPKRNASSSGALSDGASLYLCLARLASFASPSLCIKLHGYDFNNIFSLKIYFLGHSTKADNTIRVSKTLEEGSLYYAAIQPDIELKFCVYEAAYNVSALTKSNLYDDVVLLQKIEEY